MHAATAVLVHGPCGTPAAWSRMIPLLDDAGVPNVGLAEIIARIAQDAVAP
jgi:hypothetical protein